MRTAKIFTQIDSVIFDFDGVIADSGEIFAEALQEALGRSQPFSEKEVKELRNSSSREIIKLLGVRKWQLPGVLIRGKRGISARMHKVEVFKGMPEAIKQLHKNGYKIYILSSNSENSINNILDEHDLKDCISAVISDTGIFGKAKKLKALIRKEQLEKSRCVYIGDETRDIEATKRVGIKCIAVEWGYNAPAALKSFKPTAMVSSPRDIGTAVGEL